MEEKGSLRINKSLWAAAIFLAVMLLCLVGDPSGWGKSIDPAGIITAGVFAVGFAVLSVLRGRIPRTAMLIAGLGICAWLALGLPHIAALVPLLYFLAGVTRAGHRNFALASAAGILIISVALGFIHGLEPSAIFDYELLAFSALALLAIAYGELRVNRQILHGHMAQLEEVALRATKAETEQQHLMRRARVTYELHDEIAHNLAVASLHTNAALDSELTDTRTALSLIHVRQAVTGALTALRGTFDALGQQEPPEELSANLEDVERIATSLRDAGIEVSIHSSGLGQAADFPQLAMRIIREAVTNAVKHADPSNIVIWIRENDEADGSPHWTVSVRNNGVRGPNPQARSGYGLARLRAEAEEEGGTIEWGRLGSNFLLSATVRK
ncbi:sensor histidine kinase [Glutamicibacter arilaitensis]|uniref:sensor histidine kinase n=1 Tax=Glutamicibacter arilaitensis TaxID=256701 RepID=UPI00384D6E33